MKIDWANSIHSIQHLLNTRTSNRTANMIPVIAITGPVGAGKSTLAAKLSPCVLSTDHYLPDYDLVPEHERDLPERADFSRLAQDLASLRHGNQTLIPRWSFQSHKREGEQPIAPANLIVLEGIHALHEPPHAPLANLIDLRVFVEAPSSVRWNRWEQIESSGERGWGVEKARAFFHSVAEPTFAKYEAKYRARADVVVVNS